MYSKKVAGVKEGNRDKEIEKDAKKTRGKSCNTLNHMKIFISHSYVLIYIQNAYTFIDCLQSRSIACTLFFLSYTISLGDSMYMPILNCDFNTHCEHITTIIIIIIDWDFTQPFRVSWWRKFYLNHVFIFELCLIFFSLNFTCSRRVGRSNVRNWQINFF